MTRKPAPVQHVVAIPYPAQGHINPLLQLCQRLVPLGFTFTFINTHHNHQRLLQSHQTANGHHAPLPHEDVARPANSSIVHAANNTPAEDAHSNGGASLNGVHMVQNHLPQYANGCNAIRMVFVEGGCAPEKHAHTSTFMEVFSAAQSMREQVEQLLPSIVEEQPVTFLLTDNLLGWGSATASKFGLPWVCLWSASAATCAFFLHMADLCENGITHVPIAGKQERELPAMEDIPGLPPMSVDDLPKCWDGTGKLLYDFLKYFHLSVNQASFLLLNTFPELEEQVLQALSKRCPTLAVGPLLPSRFMTQTNAHKCLDKTTELGGLEASRMNLFKEDRTCLEWLDKQAPASVLFISFGSISARTDEQLEELAQGIEASGCPFLWVRRPDISAGVEATDGRQHGNGLIVSWAPQLEVLSHPAVGGFITHCGWNSVMESVALGVPMLCWADMGERMCNQRFVVQEWKCGLDMVSDSRRYKQHVDDAVLVRRDEINKAISCLMKEEDGAAIRARAAQLREFSISAYRDSNSQLDMFVQAMQRKGSHQ